MREYVRIISNHYICVPVFGKIFIKENLKSVRSKNIRYLKLVLQSNGRIDLHVVYKRQVNRKRRISNVEGLDRNLTNQVAYTDTHNQPHTIYQSTINHAYLVDDRINSMRSKVSNQQKHSNKSKHYKQLLHHLRKLTKKRTNVIENSYIRLANDLANRYDYLALESLNYNQMIKEQSQKN